MKWTTVKITGEDKGRGTASASVGHNSLSLNAAACDLVNNYEDYQYAELLTTDENRMFIGIRLLRECTDSAIKITRTKYKDKYVKGITISHKTILERLFGRDIASGPVTRFPVIRDKSEDNILIIKLK